MLKTTWLEVFVNIDNGTIKDGTKFYYKDNLYTYFEDDKAIYGDGIGKRFYLDEIYDTCYILVDLEEEEND